MGESVDVQARVLDAAGNVIDAPIMFFSPRGEAGRRLDVDRTTGRVTATSGGSYAVIAMVATNRSLRAELPVAVEFPAITEVRVTPDRGGRAYVGTSVRQQASGRHRSRSGGMTGASLLPRPQ